MGYTDGYAEMRVRVSKERLLGVAGAKPPFRSLVCALAGVGQDPRNDSCRFEGRTRAPGCGRTTPRLDGSKIWSCTSSRMKARLMTAPKLTPPFFRVPCDLRR